MADLATLALEDFSGLVGDRFVIDGTQSPPFELALAEAISLGDALPGSVRVPFSLIFTAPSPPILAQGMRHLTHDSLGELELFLVPLQPDAGGGRYQAIFN